MPLSKLRLASLFALAVMGGGLSGCLFSAAGGGDIAAAPAPAPASAPAPSGIGPAGGTVSGPYGAQLSVPAGALSTTVDLAVARDGSGAPDLPPSGIDTAGAPYALTPHGTAFASAAAVRIPFDANRIPTDADPTLYQAEPGGAFAPITTTLDNGMLVAAVTGLSWVIPGYASTRPRVVYALTSGSRVTSFRITRTTGELAAPSSSAPTGDTPISVTVHPSRRFAYVTNGGSAPVNGVAPNSIAVYALDAVTGQISGPIDSKPANGNPISTVVHPTGKFVYVVNEVRFGAPVGNISVYSIDATTGALSAPATTADSGGAPATAIAVSPSGQFAYVTYLHAVATPSGNTFWDTVQAYTVDSVTGQLGGPIASAPTGDNPWALVLTPGGNYAYIASLSQQNSIMELSRYSINAQSGVITLQGSTSVQSQPSSLAMDPEGRFLYVGKRQPTFNQNLLVFGITAGNGGLSSTSGVLLGTGAEVGPVAVVAEPQGEFVYAIDSSNGALVAYRLDATAGQLILAGAPATGVVAGGAGAGVGDPFGFAASGTSPVWQDGCSIQNGGPFTFDGCMYVIFGSTGAGPGGGGNSGGVASAASHQLDVTIAAPPGGSIISTPTGIDYSADDLSRNRSVAAFPTGSTVKLCESPPPATGQGYDVLWTGTGGCSGTATCTTVSMGSDQACRLELIPKSP